MNKIRLQISFVLMCIAYSLNAQYTYFENLIPSMDNGGSRRCANVEVINDSIYIWGGDLIDGYAYHYVQSYTMEGEFIDEKVLYFPDALVYTGLMNSFKRIEGEDAFLFAQGKLDSTGIKGFVIKFDINLDTLWAKEYNQFNPPETYFYTFDQEEDGFVFTGETSVQGVGRGTFLLKTDLEGNHLWDAVIHEPEEGVFRNINISALSNGYLVSGGTGGGFDSEGTIEYINSQQNLEWQSTGYGGLIRGGIYHKVVSTDSVLVNQGISYEEISPNWFYSHFRLYNLNIESGELTALADLFQDYEWINGGAADLIAVEDGYVFMAQYYNDSDGLYHLISSIFKLNLDFELEWYTELAYDPCVTCTNQLWDMEKAPDGGYVLAGRFRDFATDPNDKTWLVKVDACGDLEYNGCWPVGLSEFENQDLKFEIFPNPVQDVLHVSYPEALERYVLEISNSLGQIVHSENLRPDHLLSHYPINLSTLASGLYQISIEDENGQKVYSNKLTINR